MYMSDEADIAQQRMEIEEDIRKRYITSVTKEFEATGLCLNCAQPVSPTNRWCDKYCMEDHTIRIKLKKGK